MSQVRFRVEPRDVPPEKAARRLGLTLERFDNLLPRLLSRGFPQPDRDTGHYDLDAIDEWRRRRHRHLYPILTSEQPQRDAQADMRARLEEAFGDGG